MSNKAARSTGAALAGVLGAVLFVGGLCRAEQARTEIKGASLYGGTSQRDRADTAGSKTRPRALTGDLGCPHVSFIPLEGQAGTDAGLSVRGAGFMVRGINKTVNFASGGVTIALRPANARFGDSWSEPRVIRMNFLGAREDAVPEGLSEADPGLSSSGTDPGAGAAEVRQYSRIIYRELWPGIDLVYKGGTDKLNCEFIVHPGADPSRIKLVYQGADTIALTKEGRLAIDTAAGHFEEDVPAAYQEIEGMRKSVDVTLSLEDAGLDQNVEGNTYSQAGAAPAGLRGQVLAVGFDVGPYDRTHTLVLDTAGGYFGRKSGTTSIEVTGGHAGGSQFTLSTGQWIARIGVLGYMKNAPATGTLAIYRNTATADIKQHVCHTVTGPMPVGSANKAWTVLEMSDGPVWLEPGDYWILRNDSGDYTNKFVITGEDMGKSSWGWFYADYPTWPATTQYLSWVENFSNVEGCFYAEWDGEASVPTLNSLVPDTADAGDPGFVLSVTGSGFVEGAVVRWDESDRPTTWVSSTELTAEINAADIAVGKTALVTVKNPEGQITNALSFTVNDVRLPSITAIAPAVVPAGSPGFTLVVTGTSFNSGTAVKWDGADRPTTFIGSTEIRAAIDAADIAVGKAVQITVQNPGGGASNTVELRIDNPSPILTSLNPASATVGGSGFTLTVSGLNFVPNSIARWNGSDRATTFVGATELRAAIPAGDVAAAGERQVVVFNPAPAGGISASAVFAVNNPRPSLGSLVPANACTGSPGFELVLAGSGFVPGAAVLWGGSQKGSVYVSPTELRASILASDLATAGEVQVIVSNPAPAEGISNTLVFPVSTFDLSPSPPALTVTAGRSAAFVITATPQFGPFDAGVSFACTGLPDQCAATFSPESVTPGAAGAATTLTLTTKAASSAMGGTLAGSPGQGGSAIGLASFVALLLLAGTAGGLRRRRVTVRLVAAGALLGVALLALSCGTIGPASQGTPKGTYRVTVEGNSGTTKIATTVTLVVK